MVRWHKRGNREHVTTARVPPYRLERMDKPLQERTRKRRQASRGRKCSASRGDCPSTDPFHSLMGVDTDEKARAAVRRLAAKRGRRIASSFRPPPGASPFELRA